MSFIHSFPPIVDAQSRTLILGSMPGKASLLARQYYAHPRNAFWPILCDLLGAGHGLGYDERIALLRAHRIALWDVLKLCTRQSSLDSDIVESSIQTQDFADLFARHPSIDRVFFNGAKAQASYLKYVSPTVAALAPRIAYTRLPSTSPAHAGWSLSRKREAWQAILLPPQWPEHGSMA